jgi:hypothetical protein
MACSLVVGPNVTVDLVENMPESEMTFRVAKIAAELQRMEYDSAFEKAIATMLTLRVSHQLTLTTTYFFYSLLIAAIQRHNFFESTPIEHGKSNRN